MPYHVPVLLVAGLIVGVGAAVYANREEIKALIERKRLERRLRRGPYRSGVTSGGGSSSRNSNPPRYNHQSDDDLDLYDKPKEFYSQTASGEVYDMDTLAKKDKWPSDETVSSAYAGDTINYYTSGQSSSSGINIDDNGSSSSRTDVNNIRHRRINNSNDNEYDDYQMQRYFQDLNTVGPGNYGVSYGDSISLRTRTNSVTSDEPSLYGNIENYDNSSEASWVRTGSSVASYSELSTPSASDLASNDDIESVVYLSDDDINSQSIHEYQLRRAAMQRN